MLSLFLAYLVLCMFCGGMLGGELLLLIAFRSCDMRVLLLLSWLIFRLRALLPQV
jgi:hypothetical protein